jgi:exosortase/archaeosortase family protein
VSRQDPPGYVAWAWTPEQMFPGAPTAPVLTRRGLRLSDRGRLLFVLGAVLFAYHYSLRTLLSTLSLDSPLAYLGLVPFMALGLALVRGVPRADEPDIHDRQVDIIVGVPLMVSALAIMLFLPSRMSTLFWYDRVDLLSLPLFTAGAICLAFGVRMLGRLRVAIAFLLLAWPVPYIYLLDRGMTKFTGTTLAALHAVVGKLHVASPVAGGDGSLFSLGTGAHAFTVSVASACSGVDGFVGFLLVGLAFLHLSRGKRWRKTLWLFFGLALIYALNLGRLLLVFWVGSTWGQSVAIDGLHPYIGLVLFAAGVTVMALSAPLFGVQLEGPRRRAPRAPRTPRVQAPAGGAAAVSLSSTPTLRVAALALAVAALLAGIADNGLSRFRLVADSLGGTSIESFLAQPVSLSGWQESKIGEYDWAKRFFGNDSSWIRYEYYGTKAPVPVIADVVTTSSLSRLDAYNVQACYSFHGYGLRKPVDYDLGGGVKSTLLTFNNSQLSGEWNALFWVWKVNTAQGHRYERIVLLAPVNGNYLPAASPKPVKSHGVTAAVYTPPAPTKETPQLLSASQNWLANFARQVVQARASAPKTADTSVNAARG